MKSTVSSSPQLNLFPDAEAIPASEVKSLFRPPPDAALKDFIRSALIVGSRGAGKTMLFRRLENTHSGFAARIDLLTEFSSISRETEYGAQATDIPLELETLLIGKAKSLASTALMKQLVKRRAPYKPAEFWRCVPLKLRGAEGVIREDNLETIEVKVNRSPLVEFEEISDSDCFRELVIAISVEARKRSQSLLLMFDQADRIPPPCIVPILEIMNQSQGYVALMAMRPSQATASVLKCSNRIRAGDHYDTFHLGKNPRSEAWRDFTVEAVQARMKDAAQIRDLPARVTHTILALSRDSVRVALELFYSYVQSGEKGLVESINNQRGAVENTMQSSFRVYDAGTANALSQVRSQARTKAGNQFCQVVLNVDRSPQRDMWQQLNKWDLVCTAALRGGVLCVAEGGAWTPGSPTGKVELSPLLVWSEEDGVDLPADPAVVEVRQKERELLQKPVRQVRPSIFVAYRMQEGESQKFRESLEYMVKREPGLATLSVSDGKVIGGFGWAREVRKRISDATLVVADVTGMRADVMFEAGFAWRLRKPIIPITNTAEQRGELPGWLTRTQMHTYESDVAMRALLASIEGTLRAPSFEPPVAIPRAVTNTTVWLRQTTWSAHTLDQIATLLRRESVHFEAFAHGSTSDEVRIQNAAAAWLTVVTLDGTDEDALAHFVCGAIVAHPMSTGSPKYRRSIVVLQEPGSSPSDFVAPSLARCTDTVTIAHARDALTVIQRIVAKRKKARTQEE